MQQKFNNKELPANKVQPKMELKNSEYAKLFMMSNPIHDNDREKASSISMNIKYNKKIEETNPFFK